MINWWWLIVVFFGAWWIGYLCRSFDRQEQKQLERYAIAAILRLDKQNLEYNTGFRISQEIQADTGKIVGFGTLYNALENLLDTGVIYFIESDGEPKRRYYHLSSNTGIIEGSVED